MNSRTSILSLVLLMTPALFGQAADSAEPQLSPAERSIAKAQDMIAKQPGYVPYWNGLAMAYARRARETSDVAFYGKAEEAIATSLKLSPNDFEAQKAKTWVLLGRHEFAAAREVATQLNMRTPDDVTVYGYLADANAELGNYKEAVNAVQKMLDLRVGNIPGLTRAAYLRELHGDLTGSLDLMQTAYDAAPFNETEDRAWLLTQMSHLQFLMGDLKQSEMYATGALGLFPNYHYALAALARVREAQHRYDDEVALLQQRYNDAPHAENLFSLGEALLHAGKTEEAQKAFARFEKESLGESGIGDNSNRELIAYYVDIAHNAKKALELADRELAIRHDVYTLDAHAWALFANGQNAQALEEIHKATAIGVKDPTVLAHAAAIEARMTTASATTPAKR
ncbi:MAG: tetratricopeptide repeat protein [Acidobacteriota bacterium]